MRDIGSRGERIAAHHLEALGYEILAMNWRSGRYEIDIVARLGRTVAFVEVKTRSPGPQRPAEAVDRRKRRHLVRAANGWIATRSPGASEYRFDVIAVRLGGGASEHVEYIPDAFTADDAWP
jgi:putative endonuclease